MAADQQAVERALRGAIAAGDTDAARAIAQGYKSEASMPTPGTGQGGATLLDNPLQRMREPAISPEMQDFVNQQARTTATHYRNLANLPYSPLGEDMLGLVDRPSPEAQQEYQDAVIDAAGFAAGGAAGKALSAAGKSSLKLAARGFRTKPGAEEVIGQAERLGTLVPEGAPAKTALGRELGAASAAGTAVVSTPDSLAPGDIPEWAEYVIGGALPATVYGLRGADTLLTQNPAFRRFVMSTSKGGKIATMIGGLIGLAAADGLQAAKDAAQQALDYLNSIGEEQR